MTPNADAPPTVVVGPRKVHLAGRTWEFAKPEGAPDTMGAWWDGFARSTVWESRMLDEIVQLREANERLERENAALTDDLAAAWRDIDGMRRGDDDAT